LALVMVGIGMYKLVRSVDKPVDPGEEPSAGSRAR
jgi:hypothetical protein